MCVVGPAGAVAVIVRPGSQGASSAPLTRLFLTFGAARWLLFLWSIV